MLGVLYLVFTNIFRFEIENFALYLLLGLIMWNMFARGTQIGLDSILARSGLLTQVFIPTQIPGISATLTSSMMVVFELIVFGIFMAAFQFVPPLTILFLPLILILEFFLVLGLALPLSVLNVKFRDMKFIWAIVIQAGFFLTPIFYKFEVLPEFLQEILQYSPMVQILMMAQNVTLFGNLPTLESVALAIITTSVVFFVGYGIFSIMKKRILEVL